MWKAKAKARAKAKSPTRTLDEEADQKADQDRELLIASALKGKKKKQKIALCFFGLPPMKCNKDIKVKKDLSLKCWKENMIDVNKADVFIHAWGKDDTEKLAEKYAPVDSIFEDFIVFDEEHWYKYDYEDGGGTVFNMLYSQAYSAKKSIELKAKYEKENGFVYDLVLISRMDCLWLRPINLSKLDGQCFYVSNWNQKRSGFGRLGNKSNITTKRRKFKKVLDYWFISSSENIDKFSNLFDYIPEWIEEFDGFPKQGSQKYGRLRPSNHNLKRDFLVEAGLWDKVKFQFYEHHDHNIQRYFYRFGDAGTKVVMHSSDPSTCV